jgi:hypothetical protein
VPPLAIGAVPRGLYGRSGIKGLLRLAEGLANYHSGFSTDLSCFLATVSKISSFKLGNFVRADFGAARPRSDLAALIFDREYVSASWHGRACASPRKKARGNEKGTFGKAKSRHSRSAMLTRDAPK